MKTLLQMYLDRKNFNTWDECMSHFRKYESDKGVIEVKFKYFSEQVKWQWSIKDIQNAYITWSYKKQMNDNI